MAIKMVLQRALEDEYMQQIRDLGVETMVAKSEEDILSAIGDADAYFGGMTPQVLKEGKKLRWVQATSAGLDGYYFPELRKSDLIVTNIRGIYSDVIADHVFSMVMAFARGLHHYIRNQSQGKWKKRRTGHPSCGNDIRRGWIGRYRISRCRTRSDIWHAGVGNGSCTKGKTRFYRAYLFPR